MNRDNDFPVFPVTGWQVGPKADQSALVLKIGYATSPHHSEATTFDSPFFTITPAMAKSLIHDLQTHLIQCEASVYQDLAIQ